MTSTTLYIITAVAVVFIIVLWAIFRKKSVAESSVDADNEQIYVGNLPYRTSEKDLRRFFRRFGEIRSIRVIRDQNTGRSRGFAFVTYGSREDAKKALEGHGQDMYGRQMVVRIAKARS